MMVRVRIRGVHWRSRVLRTPEFALGAARRAPACRLLLGALACCGCAIAAAQEGAAPDWSLPGGATQTVVARQAMLYGAPADIVYYEAPLDVSGMLAHFAAHHPELRDLTVLRGMAVLSERGAGCLRTATISGVGTARSAGTLSRICWPDAAAQAGPAPDWLPEGARLAFDFATREATGSHVQQIWRHADAPAMVRAAVRRGLLRRGWLPMPSREAGADPDAGAQEWVRAATALLVDVLPAGSGSAIVLGVQTFEARSTAPVDEAER